MSISLNVKYETEIKEYEDISPEAVVSMLREVRTDVSKFDNSFADVDLTRVLAVVNAGEYEITGSVPIHIDLSSARIIVNGYRCGTKDGCTSCVNLGRETIDAQNAVSGWYCKVSDSDYNVNAVGDNSRCKYRGFSPKVKQHINTSCDSWKPRFSPKLEELVSWKQ